MISSFWELPLPVGIVFLRFRGFPAFPGPAWPAVFRPVPHQTGAFNANTVRDCHTGDPGTSSERLLSYDLQTVRDIHVIKAGAMTERVVFNGFEAI